MNQHFAKEVHVTTPGDRTVVVKRKFNAPAALVWRCYTESELIQKWLLGPPGWSMPVCEMDLRVGGTYMWRWRNDADGSEFGFTGAFKEVDEGRRIVHSERPVDIDTMGDGESLNEVEFMPLGDLTELVITMSYPSADVREMVLATGMTDGMGQSFELLDTLLIEAQ